MEALRVTSRLTLPAEELRVSFARSGGPGGQNVNKVASKVVLRFSIRDSAALSEGQRRRLLERLESRLRGEGELVIHASNHREQARNLEEARERLAKLLQDGLTEVKPRKKTRPTRASKRRRLDAKKQRGQLKKDRRDNSE